MTGSTVERWLQEGMRQCSNPRSNGTLSGELRYLTDLAMGKPKQLRLSDRKRWVLARQPRDVLDAATKATFVCLSLSTFTGLSKTYRDNVSCMYISRYKYPRSKGLQLVLCKELRACMCLGSCTHISALLRDMDMLLDLGWRHRVLEVSHISLLAMSPKNPYLPVPLPL